MTEADRKAIEKAKVKRDRKNKWRLELVRRGGLKRK